MKKIALVLIAVFALTGVQAQIETPQPSPFTKMEQKVGLTDVTLEYSRPSARGREVFGNLVPFDKLWRTGANKNTIITFSDAVTIGGKEVKAGSYAVFTKPGATSWEVVFYADTNNWGTPSAWDESKVAATIKADVVKMPMKVETFTMTFDDLTSGSAVLGILWEDVYVGVKFEVPTDKKVTAAITRSMNGPSAQDYYASAVYYSAEGKDINQAKTWMEKAMSMMEKPAFYQLRQLSLIYAKAGDKKKAIETAKKSLAGSKEAGNADYVKMNEDSLKEWGAK
ncbi:DUF2911 domain-containing protein [Cellulophaga fucicola]|uniref:DUF2911 domain-containing protein n=1 Tax=Cellulophaga fucicola TaxID=76595 RepID=A0A1K1MQS4_9FLAO|nr:DUF2911 domain-containing protein [Cellulophaga fucicola]SFW25528.1 Protein of unknown function [Cellulophaga fucicola]